MHFPHYSPENHSIYHLKCFFFQACDFKGCHCFNKHAKDGTINSMTVLPFGSPTALQCQRKYTFQALYTICWHLSTRMRYKDLPTLITEWSEYVKYQHKYNTYNVSISTYEQFDCPQSVHIRLSACSYWMWYLISGPCFCSTSYKTSYHQISWGPFY